MRGPTMARARARDPRAPSNNRPNYNARSLSLSLSLKRQRVPRRCGMGKREGHRPDGEEEMRKAGTRGTRGGDREEAPI